MRAEFRVRQGEDRAEEGWVLGVEWQSGAANHPLAPKWVECFLGSPFSLSPSFFTPRLALVWPKSWSQSFGATLSFSLKQRKGKDSD